MKLLKPRTFIIFAMAGLSGTILLHTSQNVQQAEDRLEEVELSLSREREKIHMLRAEWEALNRPERLERLAGKFLDLVPPATDQIAAGRDVLPDYASEPHGKNEESFEPVLQPVAFGVEAQSAPKPAHKPIAKPAPPVKSRLSLKPRQEKSFGDLLDELGGQP